MIALDTNILIYACERSDPGRQKAASELVERATDGVLLWQVARFSWRVVLGRDDPGSVF